MDALDAIETRRSVRKYRETIVEKEKVGIILEAGTCAPNAGNIQDWRFVVVKDKEKRQKLAEACLQQYWMAQAPVHIVVCSVPNKATQFYGIRGERLYSIQNCAAAIENMLLAATALDLGSCWVGAFEEGMVRRTINIPDEIRVQAIVTIGYPDEVPEKKQVYHLRDVTFMEGWGAKFDPNIALGNYHVLLDKLVHGTKKTTKKFGDKIKSAFKKK